MGSRSAGDVMNKMEVSKNCIAFDLKANGWPARWSLDTSDATFVAAVARLNPSNVKAEMVEL